MIWRTGVAVMISREMISSSTCRVHAPGTVSSLATVPPASRPTTPPASRIASSPSWVVGEPAARSKTAEPEIIISSSPTAMRLLARISVGGGRRAG
ncbi:hypothetical protein A5N15_11630 [Rothia kristinae]|uniref:Uncharacterized protein n=1 Tax=Rothia kristinae TaxID=37923 RepID=A0A657IVB8_9MICC|nr:hypothetical protein A5N15_11630 [Rothia kristinae]